MQHLLCEWVSFSDIGNLDSAYCSRCTRARFLSAAYSKEKIYSIPKSGKSVTVEVDYWFAGDMRQSCDFIPSMDSFEEETCNAIFSWSIKRGARLHFLMVTDMLIHNTECRKMYLEVSGTAIHWLVMPSNHESYPECSTDTLLDVAASCPNITGVILDADDVPSLDYVGHGVYPALTEACSSLRYLSMMHVTVTTEVLAAALAYCRSLTYLELFGCKGLGYVPEEVALPTLRYLSLTRTPVPEETGLAIARHCALLHTLWAFEETGLTDASVRAIAHGCPLLKNTDYQRHLSPDISTEAMVELFKSTRIAKLDFFDWDAATPALAEAVLRASPGLASISFDFSEWLTDEVLALCALHRRTLTTLNLRECSAITEVGLGALVSSMCALRVLSMPYCDSVGPDALDAIAAHCPELQVFYCFRHATSAGLIQLALKCPLLHSVHLSRVEAADDTAVEALARHCPLLKIVSLQGCARVTMYGVCALAEHCALLERLDLPGHLAGEKGPVFRSGHKLKIQILY